MGADISLALKSAKIITLCTDVLQKKKVTKDIKKYVESRMMVALTLLAEDAILYKVGEKEFERLCKDVKIFKELKEEFLRTYPTQVEELENMKGVVFNIDDILAGFDPNI